MHFGEIYDLYAKPEDHWSFIGWSDNLSTNQTRSVIINNNEPSAAKFSKTEYDLNTTVHTSQLGRIILSDSSLPFTSDKFTFDTTISLTAVPNEGKVFKYWESPSVINFESGFDVNDQSSNLTSSKILT